MGSSSGTGGLGLALSGGSNSGGLGPIPGTGSCSNALGFEHASKPEYTSNEILDPMMPRALSITRS